MITSFLCILALTCQHSSMEIALFIQLLMLGSKNRNPEKKFKTTLRMVFSMAGKLCQSVKLFSPHPCFHHLELPRQLESL